MTFRKIIDITFFILFLIFVGVYINNHFLNLAPKIETQTPKATFKKSRDLLKIKTILSPALINTTATSSACTLFLKNSAEESFDDYSKDFISHKLDDILKTCKGAMPSAIQNKIDEAYKICQSNKLTKECLASLISVKTASVATIIRSDINPKELSPSLLLHLIADKFYSGDFLEHPEKSLALVEALLEKEPTYLSGYKIKLLLLSASSLNKEDYYKDMFQETFDQATQLSPNDPDIREIVLAEKGFIFKKVDEGQAPKNVNKDFLEYLNQESAKHPKEWIYDYYKANAIYSIGSSRYDETIALLEAALKKAPKETRLKQTLENLKSDDETKRKHPFIMSIGFSLDDF